jgi:ATP-binding protein involved in chromosome partitioning
MFERVNTRVLGIVENMSGLACPHCGEVVEVFGSGGGEALAKEMKVPFLGKVPLDPAVVHAGDSGAPTVVSSADSAAAQALERVGGTVLDALRALEG